MQKARSARQIADRACFFMYILIYKKLFEERSKAFCHAIESKVGGMGAIYSTLICTKCHKLLTGDEVCVLIARHLGIFNRALNYVEAIKLHVVKDALGAVHYDNRNIGMCGTNALEECLVGFGEVLV